MLLIRMDEKGTKAPSEESAKWRVGTVMSDQLLILVLRNETHG